MIKINDQYLYKNNLTHFLGVNKGDNNNINGQNNKLKKF